MKGFKQLLLLGVTFMMVGIGAVGTANAHLTAFGWKDNGNGTVTMWGQHWHGNQTSPSTANGGVRIGVFGTDPSSWQVFQWTGLQNDIGGNTAGMDAMVSSGVLTGYAVDPGNFSNNVNENDWFYTNPLVVGNGTWGLFTGTNCCIDTMTAPGQFVLSGITSVPGGTPPGNPGTGVPEPASLLLLGAGLVSVRLMMRKQA